MSNTISFDIKDNSIILGKADRLCFGCGERAGEDRFLVYFEKMPSLGLGSKLVSLITRKTANIPICAKCQQHITYCHRKLNLWGAICGCVGLIFMVTFFYFASLTGANATWFNTNMQWFIIGFAAIVFVPAKKFRQYWVLKDKSGGFVDLVTANNTSAVLQIHSSSAYTKIRTEIDKQA